MTEQLHEIALTREEVDGILALCGSQALLVGGQALAFWAEYFRVEPVGELSGNINSDVDFIGTAQVAKQLATALNWTIWLPTLDEATEQTARVTRQVPGGGLKQVDFLRAIVGLDTDRIQKRAVEVALPGGALIRILHPLDVLESRLRNLEHLPSKRVAASIAQAELAVAIAGKFFAWLLDSGAAPRTLLDAVERITQMGLDQGLARVAVDHGIDPLASVPASRIEIPQFQARRWPQILAAVAERRRKHARRAERRARARKVRP